MWLPGRGTNCLGLTAPVPVLQLKVTCSRKCSSRPPGQLVTLLCNYALVHESPLWPLLVQRVVYITVKLEHCLLCLWHSECCTERNTLRIGVFFQYNFVKCNSLEKFNNACTLKSPGTLKTYCWLGIGPQNWFNWFEMGLGIILQKNLIWWFLDVARVQSLL